MATLIDELHAYKWVEKFESDRAGHDLPLADLVKRAVGANTFRAFHHQSPSAIFRPRAVKTFEGKTGQEVKAIDNQRDYDGWLSRLASSLNREWSDKAGVEIDFGPRYKLVNLLVKIIWASPLTPVGDALRLAWFLHVPLEEFTLTQLARSRHLLPPQLQPTMPSEYRMGGVKDRAMYDVQAAIRWLATKAGVPSIAFDYYNWNEPHGR